MWDTHNYKERSFGIKGRWKGHGWCVIWPVVVTSCCILTWNLFNYSLHRGVSWDWKYSQTRGIACRHCMRSHLIMILRSKIQILCIEIKEDIVLLFSARRWLSSPTISRLTTSERSTKLFPKDSVSLFMYPRFQPFSQWERCDFLSWKSFLSSFIYGIYVLLISVKRM